MSSEHIIKRVQFDPEFRPAAVGPVIKGRVIDAYREAKEIIQQARSEARRLTQEAQGHLDQAVVERENERQRGYEEGLEEGKSALADKILEIDGLKEGIYAEAEPQMIRMVMDIVEKIIGRELEKGAIVDVVKQAISQSAGRKIVVKLNPQDVPTVKEKEALLMASLEQNQSVTIREDEAIAPGGCMIETEAGTVDARLETQLNAIKKALGLL